jgi:hypothetical protein
VEVKNQEKEKVEGENAGKAKAEKTEKQKDVTINYVTLKLRK